MALTQDQINNARSRLDNKKYETTMKFGLMGKPPKKVKPSDDQPGMLSSVADWAVNLFSSDEVKPTPQASGSIWDSLPPPPSVDLVTEGFMSRQRTFAPEVDAAELTRPRLGSELGNSPTTQNNAPAYDGAVLSALGVRTSGDATPIINTAPAAEPVAKESIGLMSRGTEQAKWANASAPDGADKINKAIGKQLVQGAQEDSGDKVSEGLLERKMENRIKELEGLKTKAYKPKADEAHWTIGIGDYGSHVSKDQVITKQEAWDRFREVTLPAKVAVAKRLFTNYDNISDDLKIELVQGVFRGDFKSTHDSVRLINEGKYAEAAVAFLDNQNYRDALVPSNNLGGVATRMEAVRDALLAEAE